LFREAFTNTTGCSIELYNTDGAIGAARAAGVGVGYYSNFAESFRGMEKLVSIEPDKEARKKYTEAYEGWKKGLIGYLDQH
jgi:xylulokinase